ncbi:MAG: flagellar basal body L-ring protein FlgH [Leptospiraceae bacterium]|nr:flagellar basal body L-ring protein FlgH [Leptospiraceae bacterium]MCP5511490.1 flagellar basal body L-ring protein FlgH [Leptospiraceae bacterium]
MIDKFKFLIQFFLVTGTISLGAQSLWVDTNPYSTGAAGLKKGIIIRVILKDGIKSDYKYESGKDENISIKFAPDKKSIPEIMGYNFDKSIVGVKNGKEKSQSKIIGVMAATVTEIDENGNLVLSGSREAKFDKGKSSLKLSGRVNPGELKEGNTVSSDMIADLVLEYNASPIDKNLNDPDVQMKPALDYKGKPIIGPDGQPVQKAELSETERQKIILKNIKRLLGESE